MRLLKNDELRGSLDGVGSRDWKCCGFVVVDGMEADVVENSVVVRRRVKVLEANLLSVSENDAFRSANLGRREAFSSISSTIFCRRSCFVFLWKTFEVCV